MLYYTGEEGVLQDYAAAVVQYRLAAAQGYDRVQIDLGKGYGVLQDYAVSLKRCGGTSWRQLKGMVRHRALSAFIMRRAGVLLPTDRAEAIRWYQRAAVAGYSLAANYLIRLGA
jgi:TPR repeat protein